MNRIGNNIKYLRSLKNVNQIDLGRATGIKQSKISRIETGGTPDHHEAVAIANYFMVSAEMLLNEDLTKRFSSRKAWEIWLEREEKARELNADLEARQSTAPIWIEVLIEHYAKTIADIRNVEASVVLEELHAAFEEKAKQIEEMAEGTSFDDNG
ncbi:MAG: hypothetical protein EPGJADBJ_04437 [Saprospiraceae bacterium]|nr:hypothetical protein [Saprospiraceae bacterium]